VLTGKCLPRTLTPDSTGKIPNELSDHVDFLARWAKTSPGNIGSQKLSPLNSNVAARATVTGTPANFSVTTDVASKMPRPPGRMPMVRRSVEMTKLANTPEMDATSPSELIRTQTVAASSSTSVSWNAPLYRMRRALRLSFGSASPRSPSASLSRGTCLSQLGPALGRPERARAVPATTALNTTKKSAVA